MVEMRKPIQVCGSRSPCHGAYPVHWERKRFHLNIHMEEYWQNRLSQSMMYRLLTDHLMMDLRSVLRIRLVHRETTAFRSR